MNKKKLHPFMHIVNIVVALSFTGSIAMILGESDFDTLAVICIIITSLFWIFMYKILDY